MLTPQTVLLLNKINTASTNYNMNQYVSLCMVEANYTILFFLTKNELRFWYCCYGYDSMINRQYKLQSVKFDSFWF